MTLRSASVQIAGRMSYRVALVALWMVKPTTGVREAMRLTGAPKAVVLRVRRDMVARGVVKAGPKFSYEDDAR